ncbi:TetR/AcrR family transcriptional regulator [Consotaella aegiceratis]|uniref:TetR/AcrR family transcriptional regulator n=1 Tax=Consotaella aegiceratis TaxID=3097961 RepID=UPI002F40ED06
MRKSISNIRKPEIVQATLKAVARNGLPFPAYDAIAQEADMSRQLIRHYFPDPEELMLATCDALAAAYRDLMLQGIIASAKTERLDVFLDFYFNFLSDKGLTKPLDDTVYDAMMALATRSPRIRKNLYEQYTLLQHTIAHEVQISHPALSQKACREVGFLFVSLMYGHWKMVASLGFSDDNNRVTRQALDRLIQSYIAHYVDPDLGDET